MIYSVDQVRNNIHFQSYIKAQKIINSLSIHPQPLLPDYYFNTSDIAFYDFIPSAVNQLIKGFVVDYPNERLSGSIEIINENISEHFYSEITGVIHFGLLADYAHLLSEKQLSEWVERMNQMFKSFENSISFNLSTYYHKYFKNNFIGNDSFIQEQEGMKYTFIFIYDAEWHTFEEFGTNFMSYMTTLSEHYIEFYQDLTQYLTIYMKEGNRSA